MAKNDKSDNSNVGVTLAVVTGLITALTPLATNILDKIYKKPNEVKATEEIKPVPNLYTKGFPLTIEQAEVKLKSEGFQMIASELQMNEADPKFRECFNSQVIDSEPKSGMKSQMGSVVVVRYITQEVIDRSAQMFNERIELKAKEKADRVKKHETQLNQAKRFATKVKDGLKNAPTVFSKNESNEP